MDMSLSKLQEIVKEGGAWRAIVHGVAKSQIWVSYWTTKRTTKIFKWRPSWLVAHRYVWDILSGSYKLLSSPFIQEAPPSFGPLGVHQQETKGSHRLSIDKVLGVPTGQIAGHTWHSVSKHSARWASQNCGNWGGLCWGLLNPRWATLGQDENVFLQMSSEECSPVGLQRLKRMASHVSKAPRGTKESAPASLPIVPLPLCRHFRGEWWPEQL